MAQSTQFNLSQEDWQAWTKNLSIFATPLIILFLTAVAQGVPLREAIYLVYGATLNAVIDLLRKWNKGQSAANNTLPPPLPPQPEPLG